MGFARDYYTNGQLKWEIPFHKGLQHGIQKFWRENGMLHCEASYHCGQLHGVRRWWCRNGLPCPSEYYLYGQSVTEEEYRKHELTIELSRV
jgi:antitoxin component YwqK of YwqJK toxin-antitoxin module